MAMQINQMSSSLSSGSMHDTDQWLAIDNQYGINSSSVKAELGQLKGYILGSKTIPTGDLVGSTESQSLYNKAYVNPKINSTAICGITSEELNALHGNSVSSSVFAALGQATIGGSGANDIPVTGMYASSSHTHTVSQITDYVPFTPQAFINTLSSGSGGSDKVLDALAGRLMNSTRFSALVAANWSGSAE